ncbi:hypothetical protein PPSIR1_19959 [Plesiocystis pacifica SIR-1]|uniref:Lipoprotein n=2 Tax=Plesiocystis pacifica TaxID=191768 RepID=A6GDU4_9BACT|nr:hypothetical protein PPSIR1_19959 [Plesiocystis pacifica SIR-1]
MSLRGKVATTLLGAGTAMTLMACYGAPCGADDECFGPIDDTGGPEETCNPQANVTALTPGTTTQGGSLAALAGSDKGSCGGDGDEDVYQWTPPAPGDYRLSVDASMDTVLYVRTPDTVQGGSCGTELACVDDVDGAQNPVVDVTVNDTEPLIVVVDAFGTDGAGDYALTIQEI